MLQNLFVRFFKLLLNFVALDISMQKESIHFLFFIILYHKSITNQISNTEMNIYLTKRKREAEQKIS